MPVAEHMPIQWSFFCKSQNPTNIPDNDLTKDYFGQMVNKYYPKPTNTLYIIETESVQINCDGCDDYEAASYLLWHRKHGGTNIFNAADCLDKEKMDNYFCNVPELIETYKPEGLEFSHIEIGYGTLGDLFSSDFSHWTATIHYGIPNYCCECCC